MLKKILYGLSVISLSLVICFALLKYNPLRIVSYTTNAADDDYKNKLERIYDVNFIMSKVPSGNMIIFLPASAFTDYEQAEMIAGYFGMTGEYTETDESYLFRDDNGSLNIYKIGSRLEYESQTSGISDISVSETEAVESCANFIKSIFDGFTYEEAEVNSDDSGYEITFIERLANLRNFAFPNIAETGPDGKIIRLGLNFAEYEKLSSTRIKSMEEAYLELPINFDEDITVDLKKCTLVYHYQDSLVQPAYMFEGEISGGKNFKCFVNASIYKY